MSINLFSDTFLTKSVILIGIHRNEDKQTRNLVSIDSAKFDVSKINRGNVQSECHLAQLLLDTSAAILQQKREVVGEIFSAALEMQFGRFY